MEFMMGFDPETKRECSNCGKLIGGGKGNLKTHMKKCLAKSDKVFEETIDLNTEKNQTLKITGDKNMSTFVEVNSVDKNCTVIINLDQVVEIAPLAAGGCVLFLNDGTGKYDIKVNDSYELFRQFAMQTVSSEDIARKVESFKV